MLHCGFQTTNDPQMLSRMLLYYGFLYYQKRMPVRQYVIYVGRDTLQMADQLQTDMLTYRYRLIDLKTFSYQTFLASDRVRKCCWRCWQTLAANRQT